MRRTLGWLVGGTAGAWLALAYPVGRWGGAAELARSGAAAGLCLFPTCATLAWAVRDEAGDPARRLLLVLGGTGLRLAGALGGALALYFAWPLFRQPSFWVWVLFYYLLTLALETALLLTARRVADPGKATDNTTGS